MILMQCIELLFGQRSSSGGGLNVSEVTGIEIWRCESVRRARAGISMLAQARNFLLGRDARIFSSLTAGSLSRPASYSSYAADSKCISTRLRKLAAEIQYISATLVRAKLYAPKIIHFTWKLCLIFIRENYFPFFIVQITLKFKSSKLIIGNFFAITRLCKKEKL